MIIPAILESNVNEFNARFVKLIQLAKVIQIDFMDGKFVPEKSIELKDIPSLKNLPNVFEAHLMVKDPENIIPELARKGFKRIIFHYEATKNHELVRSLIEANKMQPIIAFKPGTPLSKILEVLPDYHEALFLFVTPGAQGRSFHSEVIRTVASVRKTFPLLVIEADGHETPGTIPKLVKAGVTNFAVGSYIKNASNPKKAIAFLEKTLVEAHT